MLFDANVKADPFLLWVTPALKYIYARLQPSWCLLLLALSPDMHVHAVWQKALTQSCV